MSNDDTSVNMNNQKVSLAPLPRKTHYKDIHRQTLPPKKTTNCHRQSASDTENMYDANISPIAEEYACQLTLADCRLPSTPSLLICDYNCTRTSSFTIHGKEFTYSLYKNGVIIFSAKAIGRYPTKPIDVYCFENRQPSSTPQYTLIPSQQNTHFVLQNKSQDAALMVFDLKPECSLSRTPRKTLVGLLDDQGNVKTEMVSRLPILRDGKWWLDFNNRKVIASEKNTIFQSVSEKRHSEELIAVRKIDQKTLVADCAREFDPIVVFGLMVSLYCSKMKA